jgi:hypothetical protein
MKNSVLILALVVLFLVISCKDELTGVDDSLIVFPAANVSFGRHVEPLFQQRCGVSGCHAGSSPAARLNLQTPSYSNLMNHQPRLVVAGAGNNSLLIQRLDGRIQPQMPLRGNPLNQNQLDGIKKWIDEGALNH